MPEIVFSTFPLSLFLFEVRVDRPFCDDDNNNNELKGNFFLQSINQSEIRLKFNDLDRKPPYFFFFAFFLHAFFMFFFLDELVQRILKEVVN